MIVTLGSLRGSPGVTSWSLLLGAAWPQDDEVVVLEADPSGGVLGARYGLGVDPGAVSLIAGLRHSPNAIDIDAHVRSFADLHVVPGPESGEQARSVWSGTADAVATRLAADERVWLADVGRLDGGSPVLPLAHASALTLLLCGPAMEDLVQVPSRVEWLSAIGASVGVVVVGDPGHRTEELAEFFGTRLVWQVAANDDVRQIAGAILAGSGRAKRSWAWRTALDLASTIAAECRQAERQLMAVRS